MSLLWTSRLVLGLAFLTVFLCDVEAIPSEESTVIFLSNRDRTEREFDVCMLDLMRMKTTNLTIGVPDVVVRSTSAPRLNPRRQSVVFISYNPQSLVELSLTTRKVRRITGLNYEATEYEISPDGEDVLYVEKVDNRLQLFEVNLTSGKTKNLSNNPHNNLEASYAHNGRAIAYVCDKDGSFSIAAMMKDGSNQRILTNAFGEDRTPRFSPDDTRIVFSSSRSGEREGDFHLYLIDTSGQNFRLLFGRRGNNAHPAFSPDGMFVTFLSNTRGNLFRDVYLLELHTNEVHCLTEELTYFCSSVAISRDGRSIVFENSTPTDSEILVCDVGRRSIQNLSKNPARDQSPSTGWHGR